MPHREPTMRSRVTISVFEATLVPGLLQTGEYARAVIGRIVNVPAEEVADRVAARLARQSLFSQERPAAFTFYLRAGDARGCRSDERLDVVPQGRLEIWEIA